MNIFERQHYSLGGRVTRATIFVSAILGFVTLLLGLSLYTSTLSKQYIASGFNLTQSVSRTLDRIVDVRDFSEEILETYRSLSDEERQAVGTEEYRAHFAAFEESEVYRSSMEVLHDFLDTSEVSALYLGTYDLKSGALIYISDPDDNEAARLHPGDWESAKRDEIADFLNWDGEGMLYAIGKTRNYGWLCTTATPLRNSDGKVVAFVLADISLADIREGIKSFTFQYLAAILLITILLALFMGRQMRRTVVEPIDRIAEAASHYIDDRRNEELGTSHFSRLNIATGDEIENLSLLLADMERDMENYMEDLTNVTIEKERIHTELNMASQIQEGMIPGIFPAFPDRQEFEIFASMDPAKEVGGDFYDFFLIDDDHLGLVMADVSGKGVPAALFMMASKILINNFTFLENATPSSVLERVNHSICQSNKAELFVTVWLGILELSTGKLKAANAGHEYPAIQRTGGGFEIYRDKHSFVVGGMDGIRYKEYDLQLCPGDCIFLYTDGVTEATDANSRLFGTDRMLSALNKAPDETPTVILKNVKSGINDFVGSAPQFDDITMLCIRYYGRDGKTMTIPAKTENLDSVLAFIDGALEEAGCPMKAQMQLDLAVEEMFVNIANYAYGSGSGNAVVDIDIRDGICTITLSDNGIPYNPLEKVDPDVTLSAEDRQIGGLGIFMVKKSVDDMVYEYKDGQNILKLIKKI